MEEVQSFEFKSQTVFVPVANNETTETMVETCDPALPEQSHSDVVMDIPVETVDQHVYYQQYTHYQRMCVHISASACKTIDHEDHELAVQLKECMSVFRYHAKTTVVRFAVAHHLMRQSTLLPSVRAHFYRLFCVLQKHYGVWMRFVHWCKWKRARVVISHDLDMRELDPLAVTTVCVYQRGAKYLFSSQDIVRLVCFALTNHNQFVSTPNSVKNPYNNIAFSKSILYQLYWWLSTLPFRWMPPVKYMTWFHRYYASEFHLSLFLRQNEMELRDYTLLVFVQQMSLPDVVHNVQHMMDAFETYCDTYHPGTKVPIIHKQFPMEKCNVFRPFLYHYFRSSYAYHRPAAFDSLRTYRNGLMNFFMRYPLFGQLRMKRRVHTETGDVIALEFYEANMHAYFVHSLQLQLDSFPFIHVSHYLESHLEEIPLTPSGLLCGEEMGVDEDDDDYYVDDEDEDLDLHEEEDPDTNAAETNQDANKETEEETEEEESEETESSENFDTEEEEPHQEEEEDEEEEEEEEGEELKKRKRI
jgi:hypothetical protein